MDMITPIDTGLPRMNRDAQDFYWAQQHIDLLMSGNVKNPEAVKAMYARIAEHCTALTEACTRALAIWNAPALAHDGPCATCRAPTRTACQCGQYRCYHERAMSGDGSRGIWWRCRFCDAVRHVDYAPTMT